MHLPNVSGYALYEVYGSLEKSIAFEEYICDLISKWEKPLKSTTSENSVKLKFVLKKRIFENPKKIINDSEENLILYQMLKDLKNGKFPCTSSEAIYYSALMAQMEFGDCGPNKTFDYAAIVKKVVPDYLSGDNLVYDVQREHHTLKGKNMMDVKRLFMFRLRSWNFFGSSIFEVVQNTNNEIPSELWLLVNRDGCHVCQRRNKQAIHSFTYKTLTVYNPTETSIMLVIEHAARGSKYLFTSVESFEIAKLINDYSKLVQSQA